MGLFTSSGRFLRGPLTMKAAPATAATSKETSEQYTGRRVVLTREGEYAVSDFGNHALRVVSDAGETRTLAGNGEPGFRDGASRATVSQASSQISA